MMRDVYIPVTQLKEGNDIVFWKKRHKSLNITFWDKEKHLCCNVFNVLFHHVPEWEASCFCDITPLKFHNTFTLF
jgi:hypothetical protein